jgi:hypothetical protein
MQGHRRGDRGRRGRRGSVLRELGRRPFARACAVRRDLRGDDAADEPGSVLGPGVSGRRRPHGSRERGLWSLLSALHSHFGLTAHGGTTNGGGLVAGSAEKRAEEVI